MYENHTVKGGRLKDETMIIAMRFRPLCLHSIATIIGSFGRQMYENHTANQGLEMDVCMVMFLC